MKKLYFAAVLSLAGVLTWRFLYPVERPVASKKKTGMIPSGAVEEVLATLDTTTGFMPDEVYTEIPARPLFFKERRPPKPYVPQEHHKKPAATGKSAATAPRLTLSGIVRIGEETFALVKVPGSKGVRRVKVGEELDGWQVHEIAPDKLVLSNGSAKHKIPLRKYKPVLPRRDTPRKATKTGAKRPPVKRGRPAVPKQGRAQRQTKIVTE